MHEINKSCNFLLLKILILNDLHNFHHFVRFISFSVLLLILIYSAKLSFVHVFIHCQQRKRKQKIWAIDQSDKVMMPKRKSSRTMTTANDIVKNFFSFSLNLFEDHEAHRIRTILIILDSQTGRKEKKCDREENFFSTEGKN